MTEKSEFGKEYPVHVYETGPDGKSGIHNLFNYLQDIASEHAEMLGFGRNDLLERKCFWVLSRIYAEFSDIPAWGDTITVNTWPNGTDSVFAMRNFEITNSQGITIGLANSAWLVVDLGTKRIQRPESLSQLFSIPYRHKDGYARIPAKLKAPENSSSQSQTEAKVVSISDLDVNLHTNNVNYLKWVYDTYSLDFVMKKRPVSVEINYLAETVAGDKIIITSHEAVPEEVYSHTLIRQSDSKEVCRMILRWTNSEAG